MSMQYFLISTTTKRSFFIIVFFFFSSRRRHTRSCLVSWARRCVQETGEYVVKRINERKTWEISIIKEILEREKEIEEIVAEMIENGNPPVDDEQNQEGGINLSLIHI
eukprot:TRINITY_DN9932_c0_g2_i9.p3 TRINITY_DN9932_c0_g2~~TRINITY_DN9932_c0_g2_i9.p3  ORF type:complete len:108 (-),score=29.95 TRINITY_DN9932_c0_g2_i9:171-494(-)